MSWLYSQALVEAYLEENFLDGEQSVQLSGNPIPQAYCAPDKMTVFSRLSRFGMTYKPLTENLGEELLTWYLEGFHAKTSAQQEKAMDLKENDQECGDTWRGWLAKYDPDSCSWRTAQCSLLGEEQELLATLPRWGMTVDGLLWEHPMLAPITKGTGCGLLPNKEIFTTPTAHNAKETNAPSESNRNTPTLAAQVGGKLNPMWVEWLMMFPPGWTDLKPLVTDKYPCAPQQLGES